MATKLEFRVDVHLDFDDGNWKSDVSKTDLIRRNSENIAETIEQAVIDEYGIPYVSVSVHLEGTSEDNETFDVVIYDDAQNDQGLVTIKSAIELSDLEDQLPEGWYTERLE